jgi:hypothetical protein
LYYSFLIAVILSIASSASLSWFVMTDTTIGNKGFITYEGLFRANGCSASGRCSSFSSSTFCEIDVPAGVDVAGPCSHLKAAAALMVLADIAGLLAVAAYTALFFYRDSRALMFGAFGCSAILGECGKAKSIDVL